MHNYKCTKCGKIFKNNWYLKRHLNRKTPCSSRGINTQSSENCIEDDNVILEEDVSSILSSSLSSNVTNMSQMSNLDSENSNFNNENNNSDLNNSDTIDTSDTSDTIDTIDDTTSSNNTNNSNNSNNSNNTNNSNNSNNSNNTNNNHSLFNCICGKEYKYRQGLYKHKLICEKVIEQNNLMDKLKLSKKEFFRFKNSIATRIISNKNNKNIIEKEIQKIENNNITHHNNYNNHSIQINNDNRIVNQHIHINPFGQEDLSYLTDHDKTSILSKRFLGFSALMSKVYERPENRNFFKPNMNKNIVAYISKDGKLRHTKDYII